MVMVMVLRACTFGQTEPNPRENVLADAVMSDHLKRGCLYATSMAVVRLLLLLMVTMVMMVLMVMMVVMVMVMMVMVLMVMRMVKR